MLSAMEQQELIENIKRTRLHQALANYAIQHAGREADLDPALEAAATEHLLQQDSQR